MFVNLFLDRIKEKLVYQMNFFHTVVFIYRIGAMTYIIVLYNIVQLLITFFDKYIGNRNFRGMKWYSSIRIQNLNF